MNGSNQNEPPPKRTAVFLDYQNMYKGAREAFGYKRDGDAAHFGNVRPYSLGRRLVRDHADRVLHQVRVYSGVPTPQRDSKGNKIMQRKLATWVNDMPAKVEVFPRPLRYPPPQGREKGVDVELAVDIVRLALEDAYDIAVVVSADSDLVPALSFVVHQCEGKEVETVAWAPEPGCERETAAAIDIPGGGVTRLTIPKSEFEPIADKRNFVQDRTDPASIIGQSRWDKIKSRMTV